MTTKKTIYKILKKFQRSIKLLQQKSHSKSLLRNVNKINLCSGSIKIPGYCNIDMATRADLILDLENSLLPFTDNSAEIIVCISAINYFDRSRALEIIKDCFRVLEKGGIARFATQDLNIIANKYINRDKSFFFQKLPDGRDRFSGQTMGDKINSWFYGYETAGNKHCKYVYDFETLALLFKQAGFEVVEQKKYLESRIPNINKIDNRPEQMFFLEAIK